MKNSLAVQAQLRLLQWAHFAGDPSKTESYGEDVLSNLKGVIGKPNWQSDTTPKSWYQFLRIVFRHEVRSSPWGLILLHAVQSKSAISEGVYLSPLPKFLYPRECVVLECSNQLESAFRKDASWDDRDSQIKCSACKGTNRSWNKLTKQLGPAFKLTFTSSEGDIDPTEGFQTLMNGYQILVGYLTSPTKSYTPQCQLFEECRNLDTEFIQSLLIWPPHQGIILGNQIEYYRHGEVRNSSAPNLPAQIFGRDSACAASLNGKIITHFCDEDLFPMAYLPVSPLSLNQNGLPPINLGTDSIKCAYQVNTENYITLKDLQDYFN